MTSEAERGCSKTLVIGVGNEFRSDDAAGLLAARALVKLNLTDVDVVEETGEGAALIERLQGADSVIIVDATSSESEQGTIQRIDASRSRVPSDVFHYSTHAFSVAEAIELARALGRLPSRLIVFGIEGRNFGMGQDVSPPVQSAIDEVVRLALQEIEKPCHA